MTAPIERRAQVRPEDERRRQHDEGEQREADADAGENQQRLAPAVAGRDEPALHLGHLAGDFGAMLPSRFSDSTTIFS